MLRLLVAGIAAFAACACTYGSDVDLAPVSDRLSSRVVASGEYCEATASSPPYVVKSAEGCIRVTWEPQTRTYTFQNDDDEPEILAPVALGQDIYLLQADRESGAGARYDIAIVIARPGAFLFLPALEPEPYSRVAKRHPSVTLRDEGAAKAIAAGEPSAIKAMLADAARETLRAADFEENELSIAIRDTAGAPDHEANGAKTAAIIELVTAIYALREAE